MRVIYSPRHLAHDIDTETFMGVGVPANEVAERAERREQLQDALTRLDEIDREVLVLRHFEELTNLETAAVLELKPTAASNRYVRALRRLEEALAVTNDSSDN